MQAFLEKLSHRGVVSEACRFATVSRNTAEAYRKADASFAQAWDEAIEDSLDAVEAKGHEMATDGLTRPVFQGGELVGEMNMVDPGMVRFFLERGRRQKFGERLDVTISGTVGHVHASADDVAAMMERIHPEIAAPAAIYAPAPTVGAQGVAPKKSELSTTLPAEEAK